MAILRLAGIYGPGRNALEQLKRGEARIIDKPGQVFNRIHVADITQAIQAVMARNFSGILNVADDLPTAPGVPVAYAAELLAGPLQRPSRSRCGAGHDPHGAQLLGRQQAGVQSPAEGELGVRLAFPTYKEGLAALAAAGEGR